MCKFYTNAQKRSTFGWATGQWSCRSNDSTDAPNGNQCILGCLINPQQHRLWGGLVRLRSWYTLCVCVCPEPALMIVGKLTWAIVILKECMVRRLALQMERRERAGEAGWADVQTARPDQNTHSTSFAPHPPPPLNINVRSSVFVRSIKQDMRSFKKNGASCKFPSQLTARQAKGELRRGEKNECWTY